MPTVEELGFTVTDNTPELRKLSASFHGGAVAIEVTQTLTEDPPVAVIVTTIAKNSTETRRLAFTELMSAKLEELASGAESKFDITDDSQQELGENYVRTTTLTMDGNDIAGSRAAIEEGLLPPLVENINATEVKAPAVAPAPAAEAKKPIGPRVFGWVANTGFFQGLGSAALTVAKLPLYLVPQKVKDRVAENAAAANKDLVRDIEAIGRAATRHPYVTVSAAVTALTGLGWTAIEIGRGNGAVEQKALDSKEVPSLVAKGIDAEVAKRVPAEVAKIVAEEKPAIVAATRKEDAQRAAAFTQGNITSLAKKNTTSTKTGTGSVKNFAAGLTKVATPESFETALAEEALQPPKPAAVRGGKK